MTAYPIPNPFSQWVGQGLPLTGAKIYIGVAGDDPETNPIAVYQDAGLTIPLAQPIRTSGGYVAGSGTPVNAYPVTTPYSIKVCTSANVQVFYLPVVHDEIADAVAAVEAAGQAQFDAFEAEFGGAIPARQRRGAFAVPASMSFFGDSFWEQPNAHTSSGNSMAYKAAVLLSTTAIISATSGNTSADKQDAIFAAIPAASAIWALGLGQNDAQFIGTGADQERKINDTALIHLANLFQASVPTGSRRHLASGAITGNTGGGSGSWTADAEIAEGGARVSNTNGDALQFDIADSRYIVVIFKLKNASGGTFKVSIDATDYYGSFDPNNGFHSAPMGGIVTNTAKTFVRAALVFDTGRRKPLTTVQILVTSATNVANKVSICSVMGLSGDPLAGPVAVACDLSDRGSAGYATASGSQQNVPIVSRIINQAASVVGACGGRVVLVPLSTALNPATDLDTDQFHPSEDGANKGAVAIQTAVLAAATDWSVTRPDLFGQAMVNGANGYVLLCKTPLVLGSDMLWKRERLSPRNINWNSNEPVPCLNSIRVVFDDGSGIYDTSRALYFAREVGDAGQAIVGNIGAGDFVMMAAGGLKVRLNGTAMCPATSDPVDLGTISKPFAEVWTNYLRTTPVNTVASLPAASGSYEGARTFVEDASATTFASVVAGGGANRVPVYCTGADWRIG